MTANNIDEYIELSKKYPHVFDNSSGELEIVLNREMLMEEEDKLYRNTDIKDKSEAGLGLGIVARDECTVVLCDLVRYPDGSLGRYTRTLNINSQLERSACDVVVLVRKDERFLLIKHFRHEDRKWYWECPRGFGENGESAERNAIREVAEETSLIVEKIERINAGNERCAYFIVDCSGDFKKCDETESIGEYILADPDTIKKMIADCELVDLNTIRAFALARCRSLI